MLTYCMSITSIIDAVAGDNVSNEAKLKAEGGNKLAILMSSGNVEMPVKVTVRKSVSEQERNAIEAAIKKRAV